MRTIVAFVALFINVLFLIAIVLNAVAFLSAKYKSRLTLATLDLDDKSCTELEPMLSTRRNWIRVEIGLSLVFFRFLCTWHVRLTRKSPRPYIVGLVMRQPAHLR